MMRRLRCWLFGHNQVIVRQLDNDGTCLLYIECARCGGAHTTVALARR